VGDSFEYLETITTFVTAGVAIVEHKPTEVGAGRGMYRVARITSASDSRSARLLLTNTFGRIADNCTVEHHAMEEILDFSRLVMARANYSRAKVLRAWRGLAEQPRHARFCARVQERWSQQMTGVAIK
jgi:hypothetical protein